MDRRRVKWWCGLGMGTLELFIGANIPYFCWYSNVQGNELIRKAAIYIKHIQTALDVAVEKDIFSLKSVAIHEIKV